MFQGKYNAYVLYTDEIDKEVDWNNSSNVIKLENLFLSSDSFIIYSLKILIDLIIYYINLC